MPEDIPETENEPKLLRVDGPERVEYPIPEGTTRIGRSRGSDICLKEAAVSRFHCYLVRKGAEVRVFDGESTNPARVNGHRANGQVLRNGHSLRVGRCELVYEGPLPAAAPAEPEPEPEPEEPSPAPVAAEAPADAPPVPRYRRASRRDAPPVRLIVAALVLAPVLAWFLIVKVPRLLEERPAVTKLAPQPAGARGGTAGELEQRMAELQVLLGKKDSSREFASKIDGLNARIRELQSDLEEEKRKDRTGRGDAASAAVSKKGSDAVAIPDGDLDSAETIAELPGQARHPGAATGVTRAAPAPRKLSDGEVAALVATLTRRIDDYATRLVSPESLEPELTELSISLGKGAAVGVLQVHDHARKLLRDIDETIETNERRRESLLRKAEADSSAEKRPGAQVETEQRTLDLSSKTAEIFRAHRIHLVALRDAVLASLVRLREPDAIAHLRSRFLDDMDVELDKAAAKAFAEASAIDCVPVMITRLGVARDPALRAALARSLSAVTGQDFGEKAPEWAHWWEEQGR